MWRSSSATAEFKASAGRGPKARGGGQTEAGAKGPPSPLGIVRDELIERVVGLSVPQVLLMRDRPRRRTPRALSRTRADAAVVDMRAPVNGEESARVSVPRGRPVRSVDDEPAVDPGWMGFRDLEMENHLFLFGQALEPHARDARLVRLGSAQIVNHRAAGSRNAGRSSSETLDAPGRIDVEGENQGTAWPGAPQPPAVPAPRPSGAREATRSTSRWEGTRCPHGEAVTPGSGDGSTRAHASAASVPPRDWPESPAELRSTSFVGSGPSSWAAAPPGGGTPIARATFFGSSWQVYSRSTMVVLPTP